MSELREPELRRAERDAARRRELRERLELPEALLSRTDVRDLGWPRRGVDAIFQALDVVVLPGYSRPMVRVADYLELVERSTFRDDRVRA